MAIAPRPSDPDVTPAIRAVWREVHERWPRAVSSSGVFNCRYIAGTTTWSQHAYHNAWDITGATHTLDRVADFLWTPAMRPYVAQVLWRVADHYDHIHVSGRPMRTGTPECAGGVEIPGRGPRPAVIFRAPKPAELVVGETWADAARANARHLVHSAERIARAGDAVRSIIRRG